VRRWFRWRAISAIATAERERDEMPSARTRRLDQLLVDRGLYPSREKARRAVMAGCVEVDGRLVDKPGTPVACETRLEVRAVAEPFVSRAGRKLAAALDAFGVDPADRVCLDVGASTGGFTDCLLQRGASRVYALDVGRGQLDYGLRNDARVVVLEGLNARHVDADTLPEKVSLVTVDVSFISLLKVVPALVSCLAEGATLVALVKPQFEAPRGSLAKGGILRDEQLRAEVVERRSRQLGEIEGMKLIAVVDSEVPGLGGNREALAHLVWEGRS
jgi:23S rRNA (cytidine1920-2'-O)/16S rRNA (cytidine1409-2'-O)-methyltransferase